MTDSSQIPPQATSEIKDLLAIMAALRDPETGCPWDKAQNFASIAPYTIEEAYEVVDAIERGQMDDLKLELGDLLLQVVYHAQMAREIGAFEFGDVVQAISDKMLRRHPHVFADADIQTAEAQNAAWDAAKAAEALQNTSTDTPFTSTRLSSIARSLPALIQAEKISKRVAKIGFDWPDITSVLAKVREETDEIEAEVLGGAAMERLQDEVGDLLFAVTNLARHLNVDPEAALKQGNAKFVRRFAEVERQILNTGQSLESASLEQMEQAWAQAKLGE